MPSAVATLAIPASGARRLRSTSTASAFSGDTYKTRAPSFRVGGVLGGVSNINRFKHHKNAVSVFPDPVGARIRVDSPRAMAGQPSRCGRVGASNDRRNHSRTGAWKRSREFTERAERSRRKIYVY